MDEDKFEIVKKMLPTDLSDRIDQAILDEFVLRGFVKVIPFDSPENRQEIIDLMVQRDLPPEMVFRFGVEYGAIIPLDPPSDEESEEALEYVMRHGIALADKQMVSEAMMAAVFIAEYGDVLTDAISFVMDGDAEIANKPYDREADDKEV